MSAFTMELITNIICMHITNNTMAQVSSQFLTLLQKHTNHTQEKEKHSYYIDDGNDLLVDNTPKLTALFRFYIYDYYSLFNDINIDVPIKSREEVKLK